MPRSWPYGMLLSTHIQCYDCDNYGHVAMDCPDKILTSGTLAHCHRAGPMTDSRRGCFFKTYPATPDTHTMNTGTDLDSVALNPNPITRAIGVVATTTLVGVDPDHSTDLPIATSHMIEVPVPTAAIVTTHPTADLPLTEIHPKMTADLAIDPENNTTNQPEDLHPLHTHHPGNLRIGNINRSQSTTYHWNTIAQMTMTVTPMMI